METFQNERVLGKIRCIVAEYPLLRVAGPGPGILTATDKRLIYHPQFKMLGEDKLEFDYEKLKPIKIRSVVFRFLSGTQSGFFHDEEVVYSILSIASLPEEFQQFVELVNNKLSLINKK